MIFRYSLLSGETNHLRVPTTYLLAGDQQIALVGVQLSCDIGSSFWVGKLELASIADYAVLDIGDAVSVIVGDDTFVMVIDGKTLSRSSPSDYQLSISAKSPLALFDAPFCPTQSAYYEKGALASQIVADMLGEVSWDMPDWWVPAIAAGFQDMTPLKIASQVVAAIGGVILSNRDGSVYCVPEFAVDLGAYQRTTPDIVLLDSDIYSVQETAAPAPIYNYFVISNDNAYTSSTQGADVVEYVANSPLRGMVFGYPWDGRVPTLVHSGNESTTISPMGLVTRTETELIEFVNGAATTRYPITAILEKQWQHTDLGEIAFDGKNVSAITGGYSLLSIKYSVQAYQWLVSDETAETIQFILM